MTVTIRPLTAADADAVVAMHDAFMAYLRRAGRPGCRRLQHFTSEKLPGRRLRPRSGLRRLYRRGRAEQPRGYLLYCKGYNVDLAQRLFFICDLWVSPEARGKGIGRALVTALRGGLPDMGRGMAGMVRVPAQQGGFRFLPQARRARRATRLTVMSMTGRRALIRLAALLFLFCCCRPRRRRSPSRATSSSKATKPVILRGIAMGDVTDLPDDVDPYPEIAKDWHANVVRLSIHPGTWRDKKDEGARDAEAACRSWRAPPASTSSSTIT